ncbi:hypothetical protein E4U43_005916 [Claviceps pusilla]|uniref:Cytoplasmic tRNA 2-thiolation protein 2 n=1 Tax=Claviceps pusilla TaxID=123648 RepID=A0A9P7NGL0_9HYPO|nr:hypothetical protein E4U43_005916 [Claviceps pusilla]
MATSTSYCRRCKNIDAPLDLRNDSTCRDCFIDYVETKGGRRLGVVARDTKAPGRPGPRRYVAGLSFGPSSTAMTQILDKSTKFHSSKKSSPAFEPLIVHIDTDLSHTAGQRDSPAQKLLARYQERFPNMSFECIHLSSIWKATTLDWSALGMPFSDADQAEIVVDGVERLRTFFNSLPSMTSRADMLRLFIRHLLLDVALGRSYTAVLLGHSTTALAALTLAEVANGRGFAVPWQINDGPFTVRKYRHSVTDSSGSKEPFEVQMPIYYPLREVFKNELAVYIDLIPALRELMPQDSNKSAGNVVSHRDLSIAEVMERYFDSVEGPYSGIVANVVRTTGKLERAATGGFCHMCGMTLDEQGDSRWAGELGHDLDETEATQTTRLCYGCKRTVHG